MDGLHERPSGLRTSCDYSTTNMRMANRKRLELHTQISKTECSMAMNRDQCNQRKQHQQKLLRHSRHRSTGVNEFKLKLHRQMLQKLEKDEDRLRLLSESNQQLRQSRQKRLRELRNELQCTKVAQVRLQKESIKLQKRKSMEMELRARQTKMVLRRRERLQGDYTVCNINSEEVQNTYLTQMDKHLSQLPTRLRRMENLMKIKGSIDGFPHNSFF